MMTKKHRNNNRDFLFLFLLFSFLFLYSCTKTVSIDIPDIKKKSTLFSLVGNGNQIQVRIGKSYGILEYAPEYSQGGQNYSCNSVIALSVNGNYIENLSKIDECYYTSINYIPKTNDVIDIVAFVNNSDTLISTTTVPEPVALTSAQLLDSAFIDQDGAYNSQVTIGFKDDPDQENYYEVYFMIHCNDSISGKGEYYGMYYYNSKSPIIINEDILDYEPRSIVFSDELFNGDKTEIPISFIYPNIDENLCENQDSSLVLIVYFLNISKEYYLYRKSLYKHLFAQHANILNGTIEPVNMYSNVSGGYGIFAGYSLYTEKLYPKMVK